LSTVRIARLTNRRELWFDPTDRSPVICSGPASTGYRPHELRRAFDYRELRDAVRRLCDRFRAERRGPLRAYPEHHATLNAAIQLNVDIPERERNYALEVST
jgi:hypothetical protein